MGGFVFKVVDLSRESVNLSRIELGCRRCK